MIMEPIGFVKSDCKRPEEIRIACEQGLEYRGRSSIMIRDEFSEGLDGLDKFSHAWVIFHLDREGRTELDTYPGPETIRGLPRVGLYASRSPCRPNRIGLRLVRVVSARGSEVVVEGLDAIDRTPVLDIKPFVPRFDMPEKSGVKTAGWYEW